MNVFAVVKDNVTAKDVAMRYGIKINRSGLACCPFHRDKTPSMKIDKRYYCFGGKIFWTCTKGGCNEDCLRLWSKL